MKLAFDPALARERLKFMVAVAGWPGIAGLVLVLAGAVVDGVIVPRQQAVAEADRLAAERSHQVYLHAVAGDGKGELGNAEALVRFRERLTSDKHADEALETIQRNAQKHGLAPSGIEYKWQRQPEARLAEVQIVMPVTTGYEPLRAFVKDVLADLPSLALDRFDLRRENIGATAVDARLRFVLYLKVGG